MSPAIAIVGMACRYPEADTPEALWSNVLAQRRAFRSLPDERLRMSDFAARYPDDPDSVYPIEAALLRDYRFDRGRFRIPAATYVVVDLTHWLALDVAAETLADAGFADGDGLPREATGVIVGNTLTGEFSRAGLLRLRWPYVRRVLESALTGEDWEASRRRDFLAELEARFKAPFPAPNEESLAGGLANTIAGRICNHFDLLGGGYSVDGACASSLLAVANACARLFSGEIDVALAGGVDLSLDPFELVGFARAGALARSEMLVFDAASNGFWPGEGCGMLALMRLEDALTQDRRVHAVIRGWGISTDGQGGLTRPSIDGQLRAVRAAHRMAGFGPDGVGYFEAHGTGTQVGDPTEIRALATFRDGAEGTAAVGSIKANIGHTKAAAGVAGLIKATLAVQTGVLPPTTGYRQPHPVFAETDSRLRPLPLPEAWPSDAPRRAGVSAFGFGGINTHLALEAPDSNAARGSTHGASLNQAGPQDAELFVFAATDTESLHDRIEQVAARAGALSRAEMIDLAAMLSREAAGTLRAAVVARRPAQLAERLQCLLALLEASTTRHLDLEDGVFLGEAGSAPRILLLFPGQAAPAYLDGGAWQRRFPEVATLYDDAGLPATIDGADTAVAQPAILTACTAGLLALQRLGVTADSAVGHSVGELAALHWGGALDRDELLALARARGQAMASCDGTDGAMALVNGSAEDLAPLLSGSAAVLACQNAPDECVLAGPAGEVDSLLEAAAAMGRSGQRLKVSHAFHSPLVEGAVAPLRRALDDIALAPLTGAVHSTVTGARLDAEDDLTDLLCRQVCAPVLFHQALLSALNEGVDLILEVGPGQGMTRLARRLSDVPCLALDAGGASLAGLLNACAAAYVLGGDVAHAHLFDDRDCRPFDLAAEPRFLTNPCEQAPVPGELPALPVSALVPPPATMPEVDVEGLDDALDILRHLAAAQLTLPAETIRAEDRFLDDLHLNSITVGDMVMAAARALDIKLSMPGTEFAGMSLGEAAAILNDVVAGGDLPDRLDAVPAGIETWVRAYGEELLARSRPAARRTVAEWRLWLPEGHPDAEALTAAFPAGRTEDATGETAVVLAMPPAPDRACLDGLLAAAQAALADPEVSLLLAIEYGAGGGALARSLFFETDRIAICVAGLPLGRTDSAAWACEEALAAPSGYSEARYDAEGERHVPVPGPLALWRSDSQTDDWPVSDGDVVVVSGGAKGIGAECALDLARKSGAQVVLLGRSAPQDAAVLQTLRRGAAAGCAVAYRQVDVTDAAAVAETCAGIIAELGPIRGLVHAAGVNEPALLPDLTSEELDRTVAVKVDGLRNLLATIDADDLNLLVSFGSIIARIGLRGEAHYALANDWQSRLTEAFQRDYPHCRCLALEWSVWSGAGMGERLGSIDLLARQGVSAMSLDDGLAWFETLLRRPALPSRLIVTSRFGLPPTVALNPPPLPLDRFLEQPLLHYPTVELIVDSEIDQERDPYLRDHRVDGVAVMPGVMLMEAMAQAASALVGDDMVTRFEDVHFRQAVLVPDNDHLTLRLVAQRIDAGTIAVVVRCSSTGFEVDHACALCRVADAMPARVPVPEAAERLEPAETLYGSLFFHSGRFRRLAGYHGLSAHDSVAEIAGDPDISWFGGFLSQDLQLGDPGLRDACIHALQATYPQCRLLPVSAGQIWSGQLDPARRYRIVAREVDAREGPRGERELVFDLDVLDGESLIEAWRGLVLRVIGAGSMPAPLPRLLAGPYLTRALSGRLHDPDLRIRLDTGTRDHNAVPLRRADGRRAQNGEEHRSRAYCEPFVLQAEASQTVGCDLERVSERPAEHWRDLLGEDGFGLARSIAEAGDEPLSRAGRRVWCVLEAAVKAGAPGAPLRRSEQAEDGWVAFTAGRLEVWTWAGAIEGEDLILAVALAPALAAAAPPDAAE